MKELFKMLNGLSNRKLNKRSFLAACGAAAAAAAISAPSASAASLNERRIAVIYFSKTGHTQSLAECVSDMTGAKLFRVETVDPYPEEYRETTEIVKGEIENDIARPIKPLQVNLDEFDVVILMTPTCRTAASDLDGIRETRRPRKPSHSDCKYARRRRTHAYARRF